MDWQLIDSAPRSDVFLPAEQWKYVLVWRSGEIPAVAHYIYGESGTSPCSPNVIRDISKGESWHLAHAGSYSEDSYLPFDPTHWMPLPAPPSGDAS